MTTEPCYQKDNNRHSCMEVGHGAPQAPAGCWCCCCCCCRRRAQSSARHADDNSVEAVVSGSGSRFKQRWASPKLKDCRPCTFKPIRIGSHVHVSLAYEGQNEWQHVLLVVHQGQSQRPFAGPTFCPGVRPRRRTLPYSVASVPAQYKGWKN
jgi:hypothetical protein